MTDERLYGNWLRPQRLSIRGVGLPAALFAIGSYLTGLVVVQYDVRIGTAILATCAAVTVLSAARIGGTTLPGWVTGKARWLWASTTGTTAQHALGPDGAWRLPGSLAHTRMLQITSPGGDYGAVLNPRRRRAAVTLQVAATGADLTDPAEADASVGRWERWLESLGRRPEVAQVDVTVETAPLPGHRLARMIRDRLDPAAPADCHELMRQLARTSPTVAARTDTRVTITFDLHAWDAQLGRAGRRQGLAAYVPALDQALAGLEDSLDGCGVAVLRRATDTDLAATVLAAFQPERAGAIEWILSAPRHDLPEWELSGPSSAREYREAFRHDAGLSASFVWSQAPRQLVTSSVLSALARPGRFRKRMTLTYVATPAAAAMDAATAQVRWRWLTQAIAALPVVGRATTAQDTRDAAAAEQATHEVAAGAGWIAATVLVTTTVLDEQDLPTAVAELEQSAGASQLRLRRLYELQAAGFYAGLPAGMPLTDLAARWSR
jgi:hypothetical protein